MKIYIVFDIGGSSTKVAIIRENSEIGSISGSSALPCINDHNFKKI